MYIRLAAFLCSVILLVAAIAHSQNWLSATSETPEAEPTRQISDGYFDTVQDPSFRGIDNAARQYHANASSLTSGSSTADRPYFEMPFHGMGVDSQPVDSFKARLPR